ncbi:dihydrolipoamide acetyltransferase family protein [Amycolatopsis thermoflava]|uniref:dihydrolipoamide acetyltransferase family protein n=1 Tax=Amycolatopsis thermoflava TaxID=84480 RepID=UPI0037FFEA06
MSPIEFRLADVGEGLDEAEIVSWLVPEGGAITRDQPVVDIETSKSIVQIPAPATGTLVRHAAAEGEVVPVGAPLFEYRPDDTPAAAPPAATTSPAATRESAVTTSVSAVEPGGRAAPGRRVLASPATRRLALALGVELGTVRGSGEGGRVTKEDVLAAAEPGAPAVVSSSQPERASIAAARADEVVPLRGMRRSIAKSMTRSWQTIPHITDVREIDATGLVEARAQLRKGLDLEVPFTYMPLIVRAVTETLAKVPVFNASIDVDAEEVTYHGRRNIGLATATPDGLSVPVVHDADTLGLAELARRIGTVSDRARERKSSPEELSGGTFTITNYGSFGGWIATPIIRHPEVGILGVGRIQDRVVAVDGQPVVRPILTIALSGDHRLIDGDSMGAFLNTITRFLESPILMLGGA